MVREHWADLDPQSLFELPAMCQGVKQRLPSCDHTAQIVNTKFALGVSSKQGSSIFVLLTIGALYNVILLS